MLRNAISVPLKKNKIVNVNTIVTQSTGRQKRS